MLTVFRNLRAVPDSSYLGFKKIQETLAAASSVRACGKQSKFQISRLCSLVSKENAEIISSGELLLSGIESVLLRPSDSLLRM